MRRVLPVLSLLAASLVSAGILAELTLHAIDFSFTLAPERVEFGWPDPVLLEKTFTPDPDLFWVPQGYHANLQNLRRRKPHIVFMGDSCTQYSRYPAEFIARLPLAAGDSNIAAAMLGVGGWSSYQGLLQMQRDIIPLQPRVAMIYFGWNDHWMGFGVEDAEIGSSGFGVPGLGAARLSQLLFKAQLALRSALGRDRPLRVPPTEFRDNLRDMVRIARAGDIVPVLVTAPSTHRADAEPPDLSSRFLTDLSELVPLHQRYVSIVREVARTESVAICDLARAYERVFETEPRDRYFGRDGIHFNEAGDVKTAEILVACFAANEQLRSFWRARATSIGPS